LKKLLLALSLIAVICALWWLREDSDGVQYTVVSGDTLSGIGGKYGVTAAQIREWNSIEGDLIEVGQVLSIRTSADAEPPAHSPTNNKRTTPTGSTETTPSNQVKFTMPDLKPCHEPPDETDFGDDEMGVVASEGLSRTQIQGGMRGAFRMMEGCVSGAWPQGELVLEVTVACSGRVSGVSVIDEGDLDQELVDCIAQTMRYAGFPAHDMPDGMTFQHPITFGT